MAATVPRPDLHDAAVRHRRRRRRPDLRGDRAGGGRRHDASGRVARRAGRTPRRRRAAPLAASRAAAHDRARRPGRQRLPRPVPRPGRRRRGRRAPRSTWGAGAGASRLVTGTLDLHAELEHALGDVHRPAGRAGHRQRLRRQPRRRHRARRPRLPGRLRRPHPRVAGRRRPPVPGRDRGRAALRRRRRPPALAGADGRRAMVLAESIYSVLGDEGPLAELADVCAEHGALLVVDEAHGLGVHGPGVVHRLGLAGLPHVRRHRHPVQGARQPGRRGARLARSSSTTWSTGPAVHLRHRPGAGGRGRARWPRSACCATVPSCPASSRRGSTTSPPHSASSRRRARCVSLPMPSPQAARGRAGRGAGAGRAGRLLPPAVGARRHLSAADHRQRRRRRRRLGAAPSRSSSGWPRTTRDGPCIVTGTVDRRRQDRRDGGAGRRRPGALVVVKPVQTGAADGDSDARRGRARSPGADVEEWTVSTSRSPPTPRPGEQGVEIPTRRRVRRAPAVAGDGTRS